MMEVLLTLLKTFGILLTLFITECHLTKSCCPKHELFVVIDSTQTATPKAFEAQKIFIKILSEEINSVTNLLLTVQVYSNPDTCSKLVRDRSFLDKKAENVRINLDSLTYDNKSKTSYNLQCVKDFLSSLLKGRENSSSSLIIATYNSVKDENHGVNRSGVNSKDSYLTFFLETTNGTRQFNRNLSNVQHLVPVIKDLICSDVRSIEPSKSLLKHGMNTTHEVTSSSLSKTNIKFSTSSKALNRSIMLQTTKHPLNRTIKHSERLNVTRTLTFVETKAITPMFKPISTTSTFSNLSISNRTIVKQNITRTVTSNSSTKQMIVATPMYQLSSPVYSEIVKTSFVPSTSLMPPPNELTSTVANNTQIIPTKTPNDTQMTSTKVINNTQVMTAEVFSASIMPTIYATESLLNFTAFSTAPLFLTPTSYGNLISLSNNILPSTPMGIQSILTSWYDNITSSTSSSTPNLTLFMASKPIVNSTTTQHSTTQQPINFTMTTKHTLSTDNKGIPFLSSTLKQSSSATQTQSYNSTDFFSVNGKSTIMDLQTPSSAILSSALFVPPVVKTVEKDLKEFIEKPISPEKLKSKIWFESFIRNVSSLMKDLTTDNSTQVMSASKPFINFVEKVVIDVGNILKIGDSRNISSKFINGEVNKVEPKSFKGYRFSTNEVLQEKEEKDEGIILPKKLFENEYTSDEATIVAMSYKPLPVMQPNSKNAYVADKVFVVSVNPLLDYPLKEPFQFAMNVKKNDNTKVTCVHWNESGWHDSGCRTIGSSNTSLVTCECNHMTPFSVLMQVTDYEIPEKHRFALSLITYIGCGLSIFGCVVLILTFMMCGHMIKIDRNVIHINLAIAIALSNGLFIIADSVYKYERVCLGVSIAMLYTFLSSFFWMLVEGVHVYLMVVKVFKSSRKMKVYLLIGWALPAIVVTLAGLRYHQHFTRPGFCWISTDHYLIWIFVGPALFVLSINAIILIASLSASHKMCIDEVEFNRLRKIARLTLVLMPIFGLSWVFGVLAVNKELLVFQYIFTALNSFQGVFLFVCYCLMNNEVKREYQRVRRKSSVSSKSNAFADFSGFSSYVQYQRGKPMRFSGISDDTHGGNVYLTKYDITDEDLNFDEEQESHEYPESVSNTLTKKQHKKNYSIELLRLPNKTNSDGDEDSDPTTGLLKVEGNGSLRRSSSFHSNISRNNRSNTMENLMGSDTLEGAIYKTFQNKEDGTIVTAYQV